MINFRSSIHHLHDVLNFAMEDMGTKYTVLVRLSDKRRLGHVIKFNKHTVWVKVMRGAQTFDVIKRHYVKHDVRIGLFNKRGQRETFHSPIRYGDFTD